MEHQLPLKNGAKLPQPLSVWFCLALTFAYAVAATFPVLFLSEAHQTLDLNTHYRWTLQFLAALREGVAYPRWMPLANGGLGEPAFVYVHPLYYYLTALWAQLTGDAWTGMRLTLFTANWAAGCITAIWVRESASKAVVVVSCAVIQLNPFYFFLLHYASALPFYTSLPFVTLYLQLSASPYFGPARFIGLAVATALLTATHILASFMSLLCVGIAILLLWVYEGRSAVRFKGAIMWGLASAFGLALAGPYLLPALTLQHLVTPTAWYAAGALDWQNSFIFPTWSSYRWGMQWAAPQYLYPLPFMFLAVAVVALSPQIDNVETRRRAVMLAVVALVAALLGSDLAYPLWAALEPLRRLQRGYRLVAVLSISASLAATWLLLSASQKGRAPTRLIVWGGLVASIALFAAVAAKLILHDGTKLTPSASLIEGQFGQPEYIPGTAGPNWKQWLEQGGFQGECARESLACRSDLSLSEHKRWVVEAGVPTTLRLPVFYFPSWRVQVDGASAPAFADGSTGLLSVALPEGVHNVALDWQSSKPERVGWLTSAAAAITLIALGLQRLARRRAGIRA